MADIANLGFSVNTSDLEKGVASLEKFKTSAGSVNNNIKGMGMAMSQAAKNFAAAVAGMNKGIYAMVYATQGATKEQIKLAKESSTFANNIYKSITAQNNLANTTNKTTQALLNEANAVKQLGIANTTTMATIDKMTGVTGLSAKSAQESALAFGKPKITNPNTFNTANIAAQFQDIGVTAAMGQSPLTIALQQGTQLSNLLNTMQSPLAGLKQAFISILNPVSLWTFGIIGASVALIQMVDWVKVGSDSLNIMASGLDFLANNIDILIAGIGSLSAVLIAANAGAIASFIKSVTLMGSTALIAGAKMMAAWIMGLGPLGLLVAGITTVTVALIAFNDELKNILGIDFIKVIKNGLNTLIGDFIATLESMYITAKWAYEKIKGVFTGEETGSLMEGIKTSFNKWENFDFLGVAAEKAKSGLETMADGLRKNSSELDALEGKENAWKKITEGVEDNIAQLQLQKDTLGLNVYETELLTQKYQLLKQAMDAGLADTPELREKIDEYARSIANMSYEVDGLNDAFNFTKDTTKGFFSDMRQGLQDGQNAWESFGDAVLGVLNKMIDKLMEVGTDLLFSSFNTTGASSGGSGSGFFDSILSLFSANGNVFANNNVQAFAKGGSFTNGIYNKPTMFGYANGGSFGVMGEAGPEAVMPLQRSSDGSLGVKAVNNNVGGNVFVNITTPQGTQANVQQRDTAQGVELDIIIDQVVADKMNQQGSYSNRSLNTFSNRQLIRR